MESNTKMKIILKYQLHPGVLNRHFTQEMPAGSKVLSIHYQETTQSICMWVLSEYNEFGVVPSVMKRFFCLGTGIETNVDFSTYNFIGTVVNHFVYHFFEEKE